MTISIIAFAPAFNTGKKHDATGAFQPGAKAFLKHNKAKAGLFLISNRNTEDAMRKQVLGVLVPGAFDQYTPLTVAFFCHGRKARIQFAFDVTNVGLLAEAIAVAQGNKLANDATPRVVLYCCNAAGGPGVGGDGGFADSLRDALCRAGAVHCQVDAHVGSGHTTERPYVRRFEGRGSPVGGVGGYYLVAPKSKLWRPWVKAMKDEHGTLRYEFPLMSAGELHERLVRG